MVVRFLMGTDGQRTSNFDGMGQDCLSGHFQLGVGSVFLMNPKNRVNPDFYASLSSGNRVKPGKAGFSEHSEPGFIKMSLSAQPLLPIPSKSYNSEENWVMSETHFGRITF